MLQFILYLLRYLQEVLPALAFGFLLSGVAHEFIPSGWVDRHLGKKGMRGILLATLVGTLLPICCWGALPVAVSFYKKGAKLGPVFAFLVATPATSVSALLVTYALLGLKFAVFIFFSVIALGVVAGMIGNMLSYEMKGRPGDETCPHCHEGAPVCGHKTDFFSRLRSVLKFAYVDMPKEIGKETLIGIVLAAFVAASLPLGAMIERYLAGFWGYPFSLIFGLLMYICSTAAVPLADAFIKQGMSAGAAMVLLLAGPVTSYGTILVLRKEFGARILFIYLSLVSIMSLLFGFLYALIS